jgi:hypothetical protein
MGSHVVPQEGSLLDVSVTFRNRDGTAQGALVELLRAVTAARGVTLHEGARPFQPLIQIQLTLSASNETASDVLERILNSTGRKVSWSLLRDPNPEAHWGCAVNLLLVN